jgi:predicted Rossmann fold flavoprotein
MKGGFRWLGVQSKLPYVLAMKRQSNPVIVIGAGGAGMLAAWRAAVLGADVLLLERNKKVGIKLLISGGGKCNVTHVGTTDELCTAFKPRQARFLKPSFFRFSSDDIIRLIEAHGVKTLVRPNGRVFPQSGRADQIVDALEAMVREAGVVVRLNARVSSVASSGTGIAGVVVDGKHFTSQEVIVSTGGVSYPRTGTTGDGFGWAREVGHTIIPLRPALAPIGVEPPLSPEWRGVAVRGGRLSIVSNGRLIMSWEDDILFSHEGISGPAALELSCSAAAARERGAASLQLDFFPAQDFVELDDSLNRGVLGHRAKMIGSILEASLPNRIVPALLRTVGVEPEKRGHTLTREERRAIVRLLKGWTIGGIGRINIERGEVTAGGIDLDEVDPQTMRSRKVHGLYFCGEILDVAGPVGGYNLQAAFSTGYVAGEAAARDWLG